MRTSWKDLIYGTIIAGGFIIGAAMLAPPPAKIPSPDISHAEFRSVKAEVAEQENRLRQVEVAVLLTTQAIKMLAQTYGVLDERSKKTNQLYQQQLVQIQEHCAKEIERLQKQPKKSCWE